MMLSRSVHYGKEGKCSSHHPVLLRYQRMMSDSVEQKVKLGATDYKGTDIHDSEELEGSICRIDSQESLNQHNDQSSTGSTNTGSTMIAVERYNSQKTQTLVTQKQNGVWSPSCQKRTLRLDLTRTNAPEEDTGSPSGESSIHSSLRGCDDDRGEPSPSVWQPFGAPMDTPQFRSVKLDAPTTKTPTPSEDLSTASSQQQRNPSPQESNTTEECNLENHMEEENRSKFTSETQSNEDFVTKVTKTTWTRTGRTSNLPLSQSPTITLLQKAREGQLPKGAVYIDERPNSKESPIPKDAILIDQKVTVEGDKIHTDSYYAVPTSIVTVDDTTHTIKAPPKYDGIGPTEYGIPVGLRTGVKDEYASDWYKTMYRSLHKMPEGMRGVTKTVHLGGYMSEPEYDRKSDYRSDYATVEHRRKPEKVVAIKEVRTEVKPLQQTQTITKTTEESLSDISSLNRHLDAYRNQPRSIAEYEPGRSSLADREFQKFWDDFWESMDDLQDYFRLSPRQYVPNPHEKKWPNAILCDGYESDSTLIRKSGRPVPQMDPEQQKAWYKEIQKGGEIPLTGLRKPAPEKPKDSPHQYQETEVNIHFKSPIRNLEKDFIEEEELRKRQEETMRRFYAEERQKKQLQQAAEIEMRRHCDFFTPSQKSPIPLNRYDNPFDSAYTSRQWSPTSDRPRTLAQVLFPFIAQSTRELSLNKGDIVYINRQVDRNWYEGEHHGFVGIFPSAYVSVIPSEKVYLQPKKACEGHGIVKYTFRAKTPVELSLFKGERVVLVRRVDRNWYEGRVGTKKGIFPVAYIDVFQEPDTAKIRMDGAMSPKPPASPVYSPIVNGTESKVIVGPTYVSSTTPLQTTAHKSGEKVLLTQSLHIDTYNEPIPYRSLYSYHPQNDDELELREGDTVYVMEKCDDGWYVGTSLRSGLFGTFPGNYVERI